MNEYIIDNRKSRSIALCLFMILLFLHLCVPSRDALAEPLFRSKISSPVSDEPTAILAVDINSDGAEDILSLGMNSSTVSILIGDGNGAFTPFSPLTTAHKGTSLATGDFNRDGKIDIALASEEGDSLSVFTGDGRGAFTLLTEVHAGLNPQWVMAGDLNNDRYADIITVSKHEEVIVFLNSNGSSFSESSTYNVGTRPIASLLADFNNDGLLDLAVLQNPQYAISILLGDGHGHFGPPSTYDCGVDPQSILASDLDGDGNIDLIASNYSASTVTVLYGLGTGAFGSQTSFPGGSGPGMTIADFNGDCIADIAMTSFNSGEVAVLPGNRSGSFADPIFFPVTTKLRLLAFGDFNRDLRGDLVVADTQEKLIYVLLGNSQSICQKFSVRRSTRANSLKDSAVYSFINQSPFDDAPGSLDDGASYYYCTDHDGGLPLILSVHKNLPLRGVRLGFHDGNPVSAPVDASLSIVRSDRSSVPADGTSAATVTVIPRDRNKVAIGSGCTIHVDTAKLSPAYIPDAIQDNGNGSFTFRVLSTIPCTVRISVSVEGIAFTSEPTVSFVN